MASTEVTHFVWIDLETNGGDPDQTVLEIGGLVTPADASAEILERFSFVIEPYRPGWREAMPEVVVQMHTRNGLLEDIEDVRLGVPREEAEGEIIDILAQYGRRHQFLIAGSGVAHFDRRVVRDEFPVLHKWLQYPALDVGVIRRALGFAGRLDLQASGSTYAGDPRANKPHRAMADILDHHAEWLFYAKLLGGLPAGEVRSVAQPEG